MKFLIPILCLMLVACDHEHDPRVVSPVSKDSRIDMGSCQGYLTYCIVTIDGNQYIATRVKEGWTLCPRLPSQK